MKKLFVIAVLLVFSSGFAYAAAEWDFYGSARVSTFYTKWDQNMLDAAGGGNPVYGTGPDTEAYEEALYGNARIGANVKVSDALSGQFEYGTTGGVANLRILWGEWNFGSGSLGVGQNYTPLLFPYSNQVYDINALGLGDTNMSLMGMLYGKREPMVRLKFGTFQVALVKPRLWVNNCFTNSGTAAERDAAATSAFYAEYASSGDMAAAQAAGQAAAVEYITNTTGLVDSPDTDVKFPNIQLKYRLDFSWGHLNFAGGYQKFDITDAGEDFDVTSYVLALGSRVNLGKAYFKASIWGGQNVGNLADILVSGQLWSSTGNLGTGNTDGAGMGLAQWSDGTLYNISNGASGYEKGIIDNDALAGLFVAGLEIKRGLYLESGIGYTRTKLDMDGAEKDDCLTWYVQSTIFLAEGVFLTPEIGALDARQEGQMEIFYAGIKWQINF